MRLITKSPVFWGACDEKARGTSGKNRIKPGQFLSIEIPVPPLPEQQAIVARIDALASRTRQLSSHLAAIEADGAALMRSYLFGDATRSYRRRKMSELVRLRTPDVVVDRFQRYQFAGVYSFGRGVFPSKSRMGSEFAYERLSTLRCGDFTYPKLMAWEGALGVVPYSCDGMVVSPEFPVFTVDPSKMLPELLDIHFRTPSVWPELAALSGGTNVRRRRLQPSAFLSYEIPVPPMSVQLKVRELIRLIDALKLRQTAVQEANVAMLPAILQRLFDLPKQYS
jgi:type I restriction enzyme S subunit